MKFSRIKNFYVVSATITVLAAGFYFNLENDEIISQTKTVINGYNILASSTEEYFFPNAENNENIIADPLPQKLENPPEIIKAIYVTDYSAGTSSYLNYLKNIFETTEINAVVIDIKGSSGYVAYASDAEDVKKYNLDNSAISDINSLVRFFHEKNIYVIGRIAVFEDPGYSKARPDLAIYNKEKTKDLANPVLWRDNNKLSWVDPASKDVWDYNISIAKDVLKHGFDEINFDYIRFPSDGDMKNLGYPVWNGKTSKHLVIKEFFKYLRQELPNEKISVDLFGQTTINTDDMGIGQIIEDAFDYVDYISPMIYPSHYIDGFIGFKNPADHPYEVVKYSLENANKKIKAYLQLKKEEILKKNEAAGSPAALSEVLTVNSGLISELDSIMLAKIRPWLQDFDMGADYNAEMVKQEIKATQDSMGADYNGFMLWNPSNIYTKDAVSKTNK